MVRGSRHIVSRPFSRCLPLFLFSLTLVRGEKSDVTLMRKETPLRQGVGGDKDGRTGHEAVGVGPQANFETIRPSASPRKLTDTHMVGKAGDAMVELGYDATIASGQRNTEVVFTGTDATAEEDPQLMVAVKKAEATASPVQAQELKNYEENEAKDKAESNGGVTDAPMTTTDVPPITTTASEKDPLGEDSDDKHGKGDANTTTIAPEVTAVPLIPPENATLRPSVKPTEGGSSCNSQACAAGYILKENLANKTCAGSICMESDMEVCCEKASSCAEDACPRPHYRLKDNVTAEYPNTVRYCAGRSCSPESDYDKSTCCRQACAEPACPSNFALKDSVACTAEACPQFCAASPCNPMADKDTCCKKAQKTCASFECPEQLVLKPDRDCMTGDCQQAECCTQQNSSTFGMSSTTAEPEPPAEPSTTEAATTNAPEVTMHQLALKILASLKDENKAFQAADTNKDEKIDGVEFLAVCIGVDVDPANCDKLKQEGGFEINSDITEAVYLNFLKAAVKPPHVVIRTTVRNVNYAQFMLEKNAGFFNRFSTAVKKTLADSCPEGVTSEMVELAFSPGSIVIRATITPSDAIGVEPVKDGLGAAGLHETLAVNIRKLDGIMKICDSGIIANIAVNPMAIVVRMPEGAHITTTQWAATPAPHLTTAAPKHDPAVGQGLYGDPGPAGVRGPSGQQGVRGDPGPSGASAQLNAPIGPRGLNGTQGAVGGEGSPGMVGPPGPPGVQGANGKVNPEMVKSFNTDLGKVGASLESAVSRGVSRHEALDDRLVRANGWLDQLEGKLGDAEKLTGLVQQQEHLASKNIRTLSRTEAELKTALANEGQAEQDLQKQVSLLKGQIAEEVIAGPPGANDDEESTWESQSTGGDFDYPQPQ